MRSSASTRNLQGADGGTGNIGLGYAISIDYARPIVETLIRHGQVQHADLGVNAASVSAETSDGARVQNVKDGSAAAKAGIQQGDVITKVGDRIVGDVAELFVAVRHAQGRRQGCRWCWRGTAGS